MSRSHPTRTKSLVTSAALVTLFSTGASLGLSGCGEDKDSTCVPTTEFFRAEVWKPTLAAKCLACHTSAGAAKHTKFLLQPEQVPGYLYPELRRAQPVIEAQLREEEERFRRTLSNGLRLLEDELATLKKGEKLSGRTAFKLYDTFGFPLDLTQDILRGRSLEVDVAEYDVAMQEQKDQGAASWKGADGADNPAIWLSILERTKGNEFLGYGAESGDGAVTAIVSSGAEQHELRGGATGALVFDRTPFYAESGGQAGDRGVIAFANGAECVVEDTLKQAGRLNAHVGRLVKGAIKVGDKAKLEIDRERRAKIRSNHSATHLLG